MDSSPDRAENELGGLLEQDFYLDKILRWLIDDGLHLNAAESGADGTPFARGCQSGCQ